MKKLTAEKCFELFKALNDTDERSTKEDYYMQALEYALPTLRMMESTRDTYRQIENDGWIEWGGGVCKLPDNSDVEIRQRGGRLIRCKADMHTWWWRGGAYDIIAYRVIENDGREG